MRMDTLLDIRIRHEVRVSSLCRHIFLKHCALLCQQRHSMEFWWSILAHRQTLFPCEVRHLAHSILDFRPPQGNLER